MKSLLLLAALLSLSGGVLGARILAVLPFPGKSHFIFMSSIFKALAQRGHQVVEYSPFPPTKQIPNYTHVEIHTTFEESIKHWKYEDFVKLIEQDQPMIGTGFQAVWSMGYPICTETFQHENIKKLINSNEHFDLVMTESAFAQESLAVFGHRFRAPVVSLVGFSLWSAINREAGNALSIASIPDFTSMVATDHMTFIERFYNFLSTIMTLYSFYNVHLPIQEKILRENYPHQTPPLLDMIGNVSLYLVNTHPAVEYPQPYTPNIIPIAGVSLSPERTPLPKDIQKFMDEAKEGVIYFSFGTVVPANLLPKETLQIFINVFKKLPYRVIWKIELETLPGLSPNVLLRKWLPQPGILAHPNCVLFLTHGGVNSQQEAINAGVPTVGVPFFGDQPYNVRFNEHLGIGVKLDYKTLSEESLTSALTTVLKNHTYKENAKHWSRVFRDRPMSPVDSAVFWTEYVLRHDGAHHLRSAATRLTWYQLALLDVVAVVLTALLTAIITVYIVVRKLWSVAVRKTDHTTVPGRKKTN